MEIKKFNVVKTFDLNSVHLYNLHLTGNKVHVTSQGEYFRCYYPEVFSFKLEENETVSLIDEDIMNSIEKEYPLLNFYIPFTIEDFEKFLAII